MPLRDFFLSKEAQIRLPNVDEILNLGYMVHVADDESAGEAARSLAKQSLQEFMELKATNEIETAYLQSARGVMLSMGRGITRKKKEWEKALIEAESDRKKKLTQMNESQTNNFWLSLVWRLLGPITLALLGYVTAQAISYMIPAFVSSQTGRFAPSVVLGLVFVFMGRWISYWMYTRKRDAIDLEFRSRSFQAQLAYDFGKLQEYRLYREQLCEAWREYSGEEYPQKASYALVM